MGKFMECTDTLMAALKRTPETEYDYARQIKNRSIRELPNINIKWQQWVCDMVFRWMKFSTMVRSSGWTYKPVQCVVVCINMYKLQSIQRNRSQRKINGVRNENVSRDMQCWQIWIYLGGIVPIILDELVCMVLWLLWLVVLMMKRWWYYVVSCFACLFVRPDSFDLIRFRFRLQNWFRNGDYFRFWLVGEDDDEHELWSESVLSILHYLRGGQHRTGR